MRQAEPQGEKPQDDRKDASAGENRPSDDRPEDAKERVEHPADAQGWGYLPKSLDFLKHRGGAPEVPERYRKFREAFLKQGKTGGKDK